MIDEIVTDPEIHEFMIGFRQKLDEGDFCEANNFRRKIFLHDNYHSLDPESMQRYIDYSIEFFETVPVEEDGLIRKALTNLILKYQIRDLNKMKKRYSQYL